MEVLDLPNYNLGSLDYISQSIPHNKRFRNQKEQVEFLKSIYFTGSCDPDIVDPLEGRIYQLKSPELGQLLEDKRYDHMVQNSSACLLQALLHSYQEYQNPTLDRVMPRAEFVSRGVESRFYTINVNHHKVLAMKTTDNNNTKYESFIGYAVNTLKSKIPNFMHTYGDISCRSDHNKVCSLTSSGKYENKLVIENIIGVSGSDFIDNNVSDLDTLNILLQIVNALNVANTEIGFIHNDLHLDNIIIVRLPQPMAIPLYLPNDEVKYINTKLLVRIIDFGLSRVEINGTVFHPFDMEYAGITRDNYQYYDLIKFSLLFNRRINGKSNIISTLLGEMFLEEYDPDLNSDKLYAILRDTSNDILLDNVLQYLEQKFPQYQELVSEVPADNAILGVCTDCYNWDDYLATVFDSHKLPTTVVEFTTSYMSLKDMPSTPYTRAITDFILTDSVQNIYESELANIMEIIPDVKAKLELWDRELTRDRFYDMESQQESFYSVYNTLVHIEEWLQYAGILLSELPQYFPDKQYIKRNDKLLNRELDSLHKYLKIAKNIDEFLA